MAVQVNGTIITMTKGDTLRMKLSIDTSEGKPYIPISDDRINFSLKRNFDDELPIISKSIPYNTMQLRLESLETKALDGSYVYDVQITLNDGTVDTILSGIIHLVGEVS